MLTLAKSTDAPMVISQLGQDLLELLSLIPDDAEVTNGLTQRVVGYISDEVTTD